MSKFPSVASRLLAVGALFLAGYITNASADHNEHHSSMFQGVKANTGTVTHSTEGGHSVLTLSDDFKVPDAPAPHWQVVDSHGNTYLLQRLVIKGGQEPTEGDPHDGPRPTFHGAFPGGRGLMAQSLALRLIPLGASCHPVKGGASDLPSSTAGRGHAASSSLVFSCILPPFPDVAFRRCASCSTCAARPRRRLCHES